MLLADTFCCEKVIATVSACGAEADQGQFGLPIGNGPKYRLGFRRSDCCLQEHFTTDDVRNRNLPDLSVTDPVVGSSGAGRKRRGVL